MEHSLVFSIFKDKSLEAEFRDHTLKNNIIHAASIIILIAVVHLILIPADIQFIKHSGYPLSKIISLRVTAIIINICTALFILKIKNSKSLDWVLFLWVIVHIFIVFNTIQSRPSNFLIHSVHDILFFIVIYLFINNALIFQMIEGIIYACSQCYLFVTTKSFSYPEEGFMLISAFIIANFLGIFISWRFNNIRRRQFDSWLKEKTLKEKHQHTLEELKALKKIVPICSSCKKIRDDQGFWNQVESYFSRFNENLEFSHSMCPECYEKAKQQLEKLRHKKNS